MRYLISSVFTAHLKKRSGEVTRNIFFDDPLFEEFALRPLILDGCPLGSEQSFTGNISADTSEKGGR